MSFFTFKKRPSLSFVFDIRDMFLSAAAVRFEAGKKPEIILCQNFDYKIQDPKNHKEYLSSMIKTLDSSEISLRRGLIKNGSKEKIGTHYFFIGSPWSISESKTIKIIKDRPFEINNSVLGKIITNEETGEENRLEGETSLPNWKVLEERIIQSKLNGYRVDNIFGKKASTLAAELFVSFVPLELKNKLSSYVDEKIGRNTRRQNNSSILSSYSFFKDLYSDKNDFIYVDLGKIVTDIYVVRDDIIFGVASMPFGEENIIQASLAKTNLSREVFLSHLNIGYEKNFDLASHNNGQDLLKTGFEIWKENLRDSLSKVCTEVNIPNSMFIIANGMLPSMLADDLSNKGRGNQFKVLDSKIDVSVISENIINGFVLNGKTFENVPHIKMDSIFLNKILT